MIEPSLPFDEEPATPESRIDARDRAGRERAVDPRFNVALEASAGTGKTRVLVDRYVNLLREGVDPSEILALTFTRKAASEMRERILATIRDAGAKGEFSPGRWRELRDRTSDVGISTIDAFCLSLLREFPLEANLDPGFQMADETEVPRLVDEALDRALRTCRSVAREDEHVALVFAQLGDRRARAGLANLLNRRIVAPGILGRYLASGPRDLTVREAATRGAASLLAVFESMRGGLDRFLESGPLQPSFRILLRQLRALEHGAGSGEVDPASVQESFRRVREHFLTQDGEPRKALRYKKAAFASPADWQTHKDFVVGHAQAILDAYRTWRRDLNVLVSRGIWRMFRIAEVEYRRTLDARALLDFPDVLLETLNLLRQMEEFAQSRFRLESRYHHVLVDEFQDTSRAQWELVSLLVRAWGEGAGLAHTGALPPSIFIVGDRKQSIYGFRDADVSLFREASDYMGRLRPGDVRRSISRSFRSVAPLLAFVNDLCDGVAKVSDRHDAFAYEEQDRFPVDAVSDHDFTQVLGLVAGDSFESCARSTAAEVARLIREGSLVRDRDTGVRRPVRTGDIAILFRTRESHREFEQALEDVGIAAYVYKGLGFFDADEIKDVLAMLWYLADPISDLRAAAWLRSRFVRMSDEGLRRLGPRLADALARDDAPPVMLEADDADALRMARGSGARWRALADRLPPAEVLDQILDESAYATELRGPRLAQARENLKKIRAIIRRIQNRGYSTIARIVTHLDHLAVGDEANAVIDATDAVSLMTVHASKGLEFPVVFVVNLSRGTGNWRDAIRINGETASDVSVSVGDFESRADEDEPDREREETKRLLYVALTRARDRLYLGSVVKDGAFKPTRGSLGEVLPESMHRLFVEAAAGVATVSWEGASQTHSISVCPAAADSAGPGKPASLQTRRYESDTKTADRADPETSAGLNSRRHEPEVEAGLQTGLPADAARDTDSDFLPLEDDATRRLTVSVLTARLEPALYGSTGAEPLERFDGGADGQGSDRSTGILVHRLLQRLNFNNEASDEQLRQAVASMLDAVSAAEVGDADAVIAATVSAYRQIASRMDIRDLYRSGRPYHEVPFTRFSGGSVVRGTIDCLIAASDRVTVLEFKTGRPRPQHQAQAEVYRAAAEALFPGIPVQSRLVYTSGSALE
jgi:ATP-dependent helicase/nuclease subunit A